MRRKRFGQHFLRDEAIIEAMMARLSPAAGEHFLEIGPGDGALTAALLRTPIILTAVEIDRELAALLRRRFGERLRLLADDVLRVDLSKMLADGRTRVVGNLPYNISTPLLLRLASCRPRDMHLMLQREVAMRLCAAPGDSSYGRLTVTVKLSFEVCEILRVPPAAFSPPPKVHSAVVRLRPQKSPIPYSPKLAAILTAAFQSRRKMLGNALQNFVVDWRGAKIDANRRAQTLSPEEFARLADFANPAA